MDFILKPSLKHMTLIKIAVVLWGKDDIRALIARFYFPLLGSERREKWQEIENKVVEKVPELPLPETFKKEVLGLIRPIGLQILHWMEYHDNSSYLGTEMPNKLYWTPQGTVDKKSTVKMLIKDESLTIITRFRLACFYCLEDEIRQLWKQIPEEKQGTLFYRGAKPSFAKEARLVKFWTYDIKLKREVVKISRPNVIKSIRQQETPPYLVAFKYSVVDGNLAATEYFLQKLTPQERKESLVMYAGYIAKRHCDCKSNSTDFPKEFYADVLCFLLSQMSEEEQKQMFESKDRENKPYSYYILQCLLDWPWQSCFLGTAECMWGSLPGENYVCLLRVIVKNKVMTGYKDYNYQELFREFWKQSPITHKRYVINRGFSGSLLSDLLKAEDKENIKLILNDATVSEKEKIIFSCESKDICKSLIYNNRWDLLTFFISECTLPREAMVKFKEEFEKLIKRKSSQTYAENEDVWDKFFGLLDDFIEKLPKKRSIEEEDNSPAKMLCTREN